MREHPGGRAGMLFIKHIKERAQNVNECSRNQEKRNNRTVENY